MTIDKECLECGMTVRIGDHHPYAACLMFKGCHDRETVQKNLNVLTEQWYEMGVREGINRVTRQQTEIDT